jgi:hypothetical protein
MNYFITRDGQQYGPYTLTDLQRYAASGEMALSDLAISDANSEPIPVAQIIGTIAVPPPAMPGVYTAEQPEFPNPPNLHWGLVLLFAVISCGFFTIVWEIVQAAWMKKIEPTTKSIYYYSIGALMLLAVFALSFEAGITHTQNSVSGLFNIAYFVLVVAGRFSFKSAMEEHFNGPDPMGISLSGVMTFFFGGIYFQYYINDIVRRKQQDLAFQMSR